METYNTILLTSCIKPDSNTPNLVIKNHEDRNRQYIDSVLYLLQNTSIENVILCDGSDYFCKQAYMDVSEIATLHKKKFEWLHFQQDTQKILQKGKGYGEGEIIEYAITHSNLLKKKNAFIKLTGRLKVKNIDRLTEAACTKNNYFICDRYLWRGIDTRLYFCQKDFYCKYLLSLYKNVNDNIRGLRLEELFYKELVGKHCFKSFIGYPNFSGICGGNGTNYDDCSRTWFIVQSMLLQMNLYNPLHILREKVVQIIKK